MLNMKISINLFIDIFPNYGLMFLNSDEFTYIVDSRNLKPICVRNKERSMRKSNIENLIDKYRIVRCLPEVQEAIDEAIVDSELNLQISFTDDGITKETITYLTKEFDKLKPKMLTELYIENNMYVIDFIKKEIDTLITEVPELYIEYKYNINDDAHIIKIHIPENMKKEDLCENEFKFRYKFNNLFPVENMVIIYEECFQFIKSPTYIRRGKLHILQQDRRI